MTPLDVLLKVQPIMETNWLHQGVYCDDSGERCVPLAQATCFCLGMAVYRVVKDAGLGSTSTGVDLRNATIRALGFYSLVHLGKWNDNPERTRQDILNLIDETIIRLAMT